MSHDRLYAFERVHNFRDFGGYATVDGGVVARGKLFRSAAFSEATEADIARLDALGVRFLVDLRRPLERRADPNKWPGAKARVIAGEEDYSEGEAPHLALLKAENLSPGLVRDYMMGIYRSFVGDPHFIALYGAWFSGLSEGGPGVIHCAAGKDRTGIGCALTLLALGVPKEAVFADYLFTNDAIRLDTMLPAIQARLEQRVDRKLDIAALRPMVGVEADYLRTALDAIATQYGSVDAYLSDALGVNQRVRQRLRESLLT